MNFLKADRSPTAKMLLVQITDTVDATETVLYRDIECSPFPHWQGAYGAQFPPHARYRHGGCRLALCYLSQSRQLHPHTGHAGKSCWQSCIGIRAINDWNQTEPQFHEILLELP